jgi:hypothetical protein
LSTASTKMLTGRSQRRMRSFTIATSFFSL